MRLVDIIREAFAANIDGLRPIEGDSLAYTYRKGFEYGVALECDESIEISESSSNSKIFSHKAFANGKENHYLFLVCFDEDLRMSFAPLCEQFLNKGENNSNRDFLLKTPLLWWKKWIGLLGNKNTKKQCYSTIAEMMALDTILKKDSSAKWASDHAGSHDIETNTMSFEVKSTIKKSGVNITISSEHQLMSEKKLELYFARMEESLSGVSINDMKHILVSDGYDEQLLERELSGFGFEKGSSIRNVKYKFLEKRKYLIDESFPKITKESFKNDQIPQFVTHISYEINIDGLPYENW